MYCFSKICRLCKQSTKSPFKSMSDLQSEIKKVLFSCLPEFLDSVLNYVLKDICEECFQLLETIHNFKRQCLQTEELFLIYWKQLKYSEDCVQTNDCAETSEQQNATASRPHKIKKSRKKTVLFNDSSSKLEQQNGFNFEFIKIESEEYPERNAFLEDIQPQINDLCDDKNSVTSVKKEHIDLLDTDVTIKEEVVDSIYTMENSLHDHKYAYNICDQNFIPDLQLVKQEIDEDMTFINDTLTFKSNLIERLNKHYEYMKKTPEINLFKQIFADDVS